ncbi:MAG: DUF4056 domain-containing protein [Planctomycetes bacterium]|nr:DUF4056 domain-containing protein [Planctomycetota bacterium]
MVCLCSLGQARLLEDRLARRRPKARLASPPTATVGTRFINPFKLGKHGYGFSLSEKNGILYTARGGHIDIAHFRKVADWTAYLTSQVYKALMQGDTQLTYRLWEPSRYYLTLSYPSHWQRLAPAKKDKLAQKMAISLGQHMAYTASTWHEMLTWFGYRGIVVWPEFQSAFTWEDNYSNLLGACIAGFALKNPQLSYSEAVTRYLNQALEHLGGQPRRVGRKASAAMRGVWFKGDLMFLSVYRRHFDIGDGDGHVSPWLVTCLPEVPPARPFSLPVPNVDVLADNGFHFTLEIEPREAVIKGRILRAAYQGSPTTGTRIDPARHFANIMKAVRAKGIAKYGQDVEVAYWGKNKRPESFAHTP